MKIALVSSYELEGGAARAAQRLFEALRGAGHDATMQVLYRSSADPQVHGAIGANARLAARLRWRADQAPGALLGLQRGEFSLNWLRSGLAKRLRGVAADVVHLHWINAGFASVAEVAALRGPVVWTAHDMWPFTGGCHYDAGCGRFETEGCSPCPLQKRGHAWPLPRQRLTAKVRASAAAEVRFVCPSRWMARVAQRSPVARGRAVQVIPNAIDTIRFKPIDRAAARQLFGLPPDRSVLLFGAVNAEADARKGYAQLDAALRLLQQRGLHEGLLLCVFGSATRGDGTLHGIPVRHVGHLHDDESLVALYAAADLFVAPSLQDNLPNTVLEANACGLPSMAFDVGGMVDLVEHGVSGWLAAAGDAAALADGIAHALKHASWRQSAGRAARAAAVAGFSYPVVAAAHAALYRDAISGASAGVPS